MNDRIQLGRQIFDYYVSRGLPPHQAAAIAGNMTWEGGGRTDLVNPGDNWKHSPNAPHSVGIGQWNDRSPALFDYARQHGVELPDGDLRDVGYVRNAIRSVPLQTQLDFAWNEMQGPESRALKSVQDAGDVRGATAGAISYHRPAGWSWDNPSAGHGFDGRLALANQILAASGQNPQPPDGMDAATYAPSPPAAAFASRSPSYGSEASPSLASSVGSLFGMPGLGDSMGSKANNDLANAAQAQALAVGKPQSALGAARQPQIDLSRLRALLQQRRSQTLGT